MPLLRFRPTSGSCKLCRGEIELRLESSETVIDCPKCGQPIEQGPNLVAPQPTVTRKPSVSEAKSAGFQVLKRVGKGEYEKQ